MTHIELCEYKICFFFCHHFESYFLNKFQHLLFHTFGFWRFGGTIGIISIISGSAVLTTLIPILIFCLFQTKFIYDKKKKKLFIMVSIVFVLKFYFVRYISSLVHRLFLINNRIYTKFCFFVVW